WTIVAAVPSDKSTFEAALTAKLGSFREHYYRSIMRQNSPFSSLSLTWSGVRLPARAIRSGSTDWTSAAEAIGDIEISGEYKGNAFSSDAPARVIMVASMIDLSGWASSIEVVFNGFVDAYYQEAGLADGHSLKRVVLAPPGLRTRGGAGVTL